MDEKQKEIWRELIRILFGDEVLRDILDSPSEPCAEIEVGDILIKEEVDEEDRFIYSILPSPTNAQRIPIEKFGLVDAVWALWWEFFATKHRVVGALGIRKGWVLVVPQMEKMVGSFKEVLESIFGIKKTQVIEGRFEFKDGRGKEWKS